MRGNQGNSRQDRSQAERAYPSPDKEANGPNPKVPSGAGTNTFDKWEMRIHKRLIDVDPNERFLKRLMRIRAPDDVFIEIELV